MHLPKQVEIPLTDLSSEDAVFAPRVPGSKQLVDPWAGHGFERHHRWSEPLLGCNGRDQGYFDLTVAARWPSVARM